MDKRLNSIISQYFTWVQIWQCCKKTSFWDSLWFWKWKTSTCCDGV